MPNQLVALKVQSAPRVDGDLLDECWNKVKKISNFTQRELNEGEPATERTEVAIIYTQKSLYIGVWCYDSESDKLVAKAMARDFAY